MENLIAWNTYQNQAMHRQLTITRIYCCDIHAEIGIRIAIIRRFDEHARNE